MTINDMKTILYAKLQNEGCLFNKNDISIVKDKKGLKVIIKDYEHIPFIISTEYDEYFKYCVYVYDEFDEKCIVFVDSKEDFNIALALIRLGYYIGTRF